MRRLFRLLADLAAAGSNLPQALRVHWRNARTLSVHNPLIYKLRAVGDHVLNDAALPYAWSAGRR